MQQGESGDEALSSVPAVELTRVPVGLALRVPSFIGVLGDSTLCVLTRNGEEVDSRVSLPDRQATSG